MMRWVVLLAVLPLSAQTAEEHADKAAAFVQSGDLKNAEAELRKAVELSPDDAELLTSLGGVLAMEKDARGANIYLSRAVQIDGANPLLRRNLAANQLQLGQLKEAKANLEQLLRANPQDRAATFLLGMVSAGLHDDARSIALLESVPEMVARKPEAAAALAVARCRVLIGAGNLTGALEIAAAAPEAPETVMMKASLQAELYYYTDAVATWKRAVALNPDSADAHRGLAVAEWRAGMKDDATTEFESALKQFPRDALLRSEYGTLLVENASPRGVELLKSAVELDDNLAEAHYQLGNAELTSGHLPEALHHLHRAASLDSQSAKVHFALSRVYRRLGRSGDADREHALWQRLKNEEQQVAGTRPAFGTGHD